MSGEKGGRRLRDGKKRSQSSRRWLERQLTDPYVAEAKRRGYRSRAAFKLLELDQRFRLLRPGMRVVDLGAAPGGWTQVAVHQVRADRVADTTAVAGKPSLSSRVIAVDCESMADVPGASVLRVDFLAPHAPDLIRAALDGPADVVLSDMAPPSSGHAAADHLRIMGLAELALEFAADVLAPDGAFVCKVWQGGTESQLLAQMKRQFRSVRHAKPPASRPESAELYVVATGFRGRSPATMPTDAV